MPNRQLAIWFVVGFVMSVGMSLGGMAHESSLYFFDPFRTGRHELFQWSMMILFCSAVIPTFIYWHFFNRGTSPWFDDKWHIPTSTEVDPGLVLGSVIFGTGWALGGFCPGPSVSGLITGHPNFVMFSYGMYVYNVVRPYDKIPATERHWGLTIILGFVPALLYFLGPLVFPLDTAPRVISWPVSLSVLGGLGIGLAAIIMYQFNGRVLGLCGFWRNILDTKIHTVSRLPQVLFFIAFMLGAAVTCTIAPESFSSPPNEDRGLGWVFLGGLLVAHGTEWANGCTSGHGICGLARLSVRSLIAVPSFMAAVFVCVPLFNQLLGS